MAVFYIRERNAFYSWLTLNHISPTAQALWNALFTIYNAQGWPDEWLEVPESLLCSYCLEIIGVHYSLDGVTDIDFNTPTAFIELSTEKIGKTWRPWTKQPTEEQRETAKRNGG